MKAKDEARLSALRMVKSALHLRQVEKMAPLDEKESQAVLATLIKQRKESVEQFTKGGRQEMADKEAAEIVLIESYLPKAAGEAEVIAGVKATIAEMGSPTMKEMGHSYEECHGPPQCRRHARRRENGQRNREEGTGGEVARFVWGQPPPAVRSSEARPRGTSRSLGFDIVFAHVESRVLSFSCRRRHCSCGRQARSRRTGGCEP